MRGLRRRCCKAPGIDPIFLLAPTSTDAAHRSRSAACASGYVYYVSLKGVTGAGHLDIGAVEQMMPRIKRAREAAGRRRLRHPRRARPRARSADVADAVVIGSALIQLLEGQPRDDVAPRGAGDFIAGIRAALDALRDLRATGEHRQGTAMSWLEKLLPPKIQPTDPSERRTVPEGLWSNARRARRCCTRPTSSRTINVCPKCGHHHRIGARARLDAFLDPEGRYEIGQEVLPVDALKFKDSKQVPRAAEGRAREHRRDRRAGRDGRRGA